MARTITLESLYKKLEKATEKFNEADADLQKAKKNYDDAKAALSAINAEITKMEFAEFTKKLIASGKTMEDVYAFLEVR